MSITSLEKLRGFAADVGGVHFVVRWGDTVVDCLVTCDALARHFRRADDSGSRDWLHLYDASEARIHALARRMIGAMAQPAAALVLTVDDVQRALAAFGDDGLPGRVPA